MGVTPPVVVRSSSGLLVVSVAPVRQQCNNYGIPLMQWSPPQLQWTLDPLTHSVRFRDTPLLHPMPAKAPRMALVIDEAVKDKITFLASKHRRSTSAEIVVAVEAWLEQHNEELGDFTPQS